MKKIILLIPFIIIYLIIMYNLNNVKIEESNYILGIGIDKGKENYFKYTFQVPKTPNLSLKVYGNPLLQESNNFSEISIEAKSISRAIELANSISPHPFIPSHVKAIIFSDKLSKSEIDTNIKQILNSSQFSHSSYLAISNCDTIDLLRNFGHSSKNYFDTISNSQNFGGLTAITKISDYYSNKNASILTYIGMNLNAEESINIYENDLVLDYNKTPYATGIAVFDSKKLIGKLTSSQTKDYLILKNNYKNITYSIPDMYDSNANLILRITNQFEPNIRVDVTSQTPRIYIKVPLYITVLSNPSKNVTETDSEYQALKEYIQRYFKKEIVSFLKYTSEDLSTDILGFENNVKANFWTLKEYEKYNWADKYKDAKFIVDVEADLKVM